MNTIFVRSSYTLAIINNLHLKNLLYNAAGIVIQASLQPYPTKKQRSLVLNGFYCNFTLVFIVKI